MPRRRLKGFVKGVINRFNRLRGRRRNPITDQPAENPYQIDNSSPTAQQTIYEEVGDLPSRNLPSQDEESIILGPNSLSTTNAQASKQNLSSIYRSNGDGTKKFKGRTIAQNGVLRALLRAFINGKNHGQHGNIGSAKFHNDSPLIGIKNGQSVNPREIRVKQAFTGQYGTMFSKYGHNTRAEGEMVEAERAIEQWQHILSDPDSLNKYKKAFQTSLEAARIIKDEKLAEGKLNQIMDKKSGTRFHINDDLDIYKFQISGRSIQIANSDGTPLIGKDGRLGREFSLNSFCYPPFKNHRNNLGVLKDKVTAQFKLALQNLKQEMQETGKKQGLFAVNQPGAFIRGMTKKQKDEVAQIIIESLKEAKNEFGADNIKIVFSGSTDKSKDSVGNSVDFGWGGHLEQIKEICTGNANAEIEEAFTDMDFMKIVDECEEKDIAFQVPMMGEPLGKIGNAASTDSADFALDEFLARITAGMHCISFNSEQNENLMNRVTSVDLNNHSSTRQNQSPLPSSAGTRQFRTPVSPRQSATRDEDLNYTKAKDRLIELIEKKKNLGISEAAGGQGVEELEGIINNFASGDKSENILNFFKLNKNESMTEVSKTDRFYLVNFTNLQEANNFSQNLFSKGISSKTNPSNKRFVGGEGGSHTVRLYRGDFVKLKAKYEQLTEEIEGANSILRGEKPKSNLRVNTIGNTESSPLESLLEKWGAKLDSFDARDRNTGNEITMTQIQFKGENPREALKKAQDFPKEVLLQAGVYSFRKGEGKAKTPVRRNEDGRALDKTERSEQGTQFTINLNPDEVLNLKKYCNRNKDYLPSPSPSTTVRHTRGAERIRLDLNELENVTMV